jgi:hypothetical protein
MTYAKDLRDRRLTILLPTTGDRWTSLHEYFYDSYQTNGMSAVLVIFFGCI